jgi:hypothetical protein
MAESSNPVTSRRHGAGGLPAACVVLLALTGCTGPAWSPDSQRVVARVGPEDGEHGLAMVDISGRFVRWVARTDDPGTTFTQAAWSPDGSRIAYQRIEERESEQGDGRRVGLRIHTLFVQDAAAAEERVLRSTEHREQPGMDLGGIIQPPPQWIGGSDTLLLVDLDEPEPLLLGMDGATRKAPALPDEEMILPALSADGKRYAYLGGTPQERFVDLMVGGPGSEAQPVARLMLLTSDQSSGTDSSLEGILDIPVPVVPVWTADGRAVLVCGLTGAMGDRTVGVAYRVDARSGEVKTVWQKESARPVNVSASADGNVIGISYWLHHESGGGVAVARIDTGECVDVYSSPNVSVGPSSVSPDGRWLACAAGDDESIVLLIGTAGKEFRVCSVGPRSAERTLAFLRDRAMANLEDMGVADALLRVRANPEAPLSRDELPLFMAPLDAAARDHPTPPRRQAIEYARALVCLAIAEDVPAEQAAGLRRRAEGHLDLFLAGQPNAEVRAALRKAFWDGAQRPAAAGPGASTAGASAGPTEGGADGG